MNVHSTSRNFKNNAKEQLANADLQAALTRRIDPDQVSAAAQASQAALVERHGGRETVLNMGSFQGTPAPGEKAEYVQ
mgnify:CR=1 FL=1